MRVREVLLRLLMSLCILGLVLWFDRFSLVFLAAVGIVAVWVAPGPSRR